MKKIILLAAVAAICCSCGTTKISKSVVRSAPFIDLEGTVSSTVTLADLNVGEKHVSGTWSITPADRETNIGYDKSAVQKIAVANALDASDADILVAPKWSITYEKGRIVEVVVTGYPAKYGNFRTKPEPEAGCKEAAGDPTIVIYNNKK